jgi:hypothetical protein
MSIPLGIKITLRDPEDSAKLIHAQFATVRSHPELKDRLKRCALLDVRESVAVRRMQLADRKLWDAEDDAAIEAAEKALAAAVAVRNEVTEELIAAARDFVEAGFRAAGSTQEHASWLADRVAMEDLPELKAKCLYGAGALDFTKTSGGQS